MTAGRPRRVACPGCGQPAAFEPSNPHRPFCSERCRLQDLGAWASESYRIPVSNEAPPDADSPDAANNPPD